MHKQYFHVKTEQDARQLASILSFNGYKTWVKTIQTSPLKYDMQYYVHYQQKEIN